MREALLRWPLLLLVVAWGASAFAAEEACRLVEGGGEITVQGLGRVVFRELVTDRLDDSASFSGEVCLSITGAGMVVRSEGLRVFGLMGTLQLEADGVQVQAGDWQLEAAAMSANLASASMAEVSLRGPDAIGRAQSITIDLLSGTIQGSELRLATSQLRLDAERAQLEGDLLLADGLLLTSCDCPPESASVRLEARSARVDLSQTIAWLEGGVAVVAGLRWELPDPTEISERSLSAVQLPFTIGSDATGRRGLIVGSPLREVAEGVRYSWEVGSGDDRQPPDLRFRLNADQGAHNLQFLGASDRLSLRWDSTAQLGGGWRLVAGQRFEGGAIEDPVRRSSLRLGWQRTLDPPLPWVPTTAVGLGVTAAYTAQTQASAEVVGPSLALDGSLNLGGWRPAGWRPALALALSHSVYPSQQASQTWWSLNPTVQGSVGPLRLQLGYFGRWLRGGSPFTSSVDRVQAEQRVDFSANLEQPLSSTWQAGLGLGVRYVFSPDSLRPGLPLGWATLDPSFSLRGPVADGELRLELRARLGGWVDPRPSRDGSLTASLRWVQQGLGWEGGIRTSWGLVNGQGLREITLLAAVPIRWDGGRYLLRPYLAVDAYTFMGGHGPWLRGYGLDIGWSTCCGRIEVGYRYDEYDGSGARFAVTLETHPLDAGRLRAAAGQGGDAPP